MESVDNLFAQWAHLLLVWVGFGTLVGLLAKAIMPGRDPGGAFSTVIIGILGSVIGASVLLFFSENLRITPISPVGFVVATIGTTLLLVLYRLLNSRFLNATFPLYRRRRYRAPVSLLEDE